MHTRSEEYLASQREKDKLRAQRPDRRAQLLEARAKYRKKPEVVADQKKLDATRKKRKAERKIVGVDGEGQDTPDGGHIYTYLAAVDEFGVLVADAHNPAGLSHAECARMLLSIPKNTLKFGFMFSYDVTKIIEQMPLADRYVLMRPDTRNAKSCMFCKHLFVNGKECPECGSEKIRTFTRSLKYKGRKYGYFNGSLTIAVDKNDEYETAARSTKIWDCFRFFGCSFVQALTDWKIGTDEQRARILDMKNKRGEFATEDPEAVKAYCQEECHLLAVMMRKLITAHEEAGIPLTRFEGAGSTATALLKKHSVSKYKGPPIREYEPALAHAVASAFFGGRFENSVIGKVEKPVDGYDIASAYPYAQTFLPCLECGKWKRVKRPKRAQLEKAHAAVVKFNVRDVPKKERLALAWCPLPFRSPEGSITYGTNFSGWAWSPEALSAERGWSDMVTLGEAWIYTTKCTHRPFAYVPGGFRLRNEWGKEGKGIVMKLGLNAGYGKTAQSLGEDPPFQSWVWAGLTTATTRGQILDAIASVTDRHAILAIATDGIYASCKLDLPAPRDTGTSDIWKKTKDDNGVENGGYFCPLGCWEHKAVPEGIFLAKPGLYYRLGAKLSDVRARGVGRREVFSERKRLEAAFDSWDRLDMKHAVTVVSRRFYGAKHSIYARSACNKCDTSWAGIPERGCPECGAIGSTFTVTPLDRKNGKVAYGTWDVRDVNIAFDPHPKRERILRRGGTSVRLHIRDLRGQVSAPYDVGTMSPEAGAARMGKELALEQPDWNDE